MGNNEVGEHSRKSTNSNGDERPFKKARYVWQLKGKYHLKENYKQSVSPDIKEGSSKDFGGEANDSENISSNNNNGNSINNNDSCNKCCLDTLLAHSNAFLETDDTSDQETGAADIDRSMLDEIPVTLVKPNPKNHDDFLNKWQARQVAKSFVDNTINSILEQWKLAPVDAADFVENCDSGGQVEDEGILMAIQSHGLHSGGVRYDRFENAPRSQGDLNRSVGRNTPVSFIQVDESTLDNFENAHNEIVKQKSVGESEMSCDSDVDKAVYASNPNLEIGDPMDFLNAAVSVAIQKKGLSSYNYG